MLIIQQGDAYALPFMIKKDGVYMTPSNLVDLRIQIDDKLKSYLNNELTYNTTENYWEYPLTQEESLALLGVTSNLQVGIKETDITSYSPVQLFYVGNSIIKKGW